MRKRLMFKYIPFSCNKITQPFSRPQGWVYNVGSGFELRLTSSSFHSAD